MKAGAVDIGTNSTRLLVVEGGSEDFRELQRQTVITGLGQGVDATGKLDPEAASRTLEVLAEYGSELYSLEVELVRAVATSASRDAANRDEFFESVTEVLGVEPELVSGEEEATLAFAGASSVAEERPCLVIDIGGGSTEYVFGSESPTYVKSVDMGSVRLTERVLHERPASPKQVMRARALVEAAVEDVVLPGAPEAVIGVAGTFTSLAAMNLDLEEYDSEQVHGSVLDYPDLLSLVDWLSEMSVEETAAIPSLDPARAPVILAGAVVALSSMLEFDLDSVTVSERDLLHGIVIGLLGE